MARPLKQGMDYFPHDCDASEDEKIEALRALYGNDGYAFYFILLERIYRTDNAELDISKKAILAALIKKISISEQKFYEILNTAFDIELFDKQIYEESNVITSKGIKKRFGEVETMRKRWRKRKENKVENKEDTSIIFPMENSEETGESKVKESKVKESKVNNNITLSTDEQNFIEILQTINNYPFDIENDVKMYHDLSERYPQLDILQAIKKFAIYKKDKPLNDNSNARSQIDTSFKKYVEWGQCLNDQNKKSKREVWV